MRLLLFLHFPLQKVDKHIKRTNKLNHRRLQAKHLYTSNAYKESEDLMNPSSKENIPEGLQQK